MCSTFLSSFVSVGYVSDVSSISIYLVFAYTLAFAVIGVYTRLIGCFSWAVLFDGVHRDRGSCALIYADR